MLTQERLKEVVTYNFITGYFTSNKFSKFCNKEIGERVGTKHKTKGYRYLTIDGKTYREQRLAFLYLTGYWPKEQVDHVNRIKDCNSWINLQDVSAATNSQRRGLFSTNKSGYTGVVWNKASNKWQVLCRKNGVQKFLGLFDDLKEAGKVANDFYQS